MFFDTTKRRKSTVLPGHEPARMGDGEADVLVTWKEETRCKGCIDITLHLRRMNILYIQKKEGKEKSQTP